MKKYDITGMSCAACSARIEKAVNSLDNVESCTVNLLTNSMTVLGEVSEEAVMGAVEAAGYGITPSGKKQDNPSKDGFDKNDEENAIKKRFFNSIGFLIVLMYLSMGTMWGAPLPKILEQNYMAQSILQMLCGIIIIVINRKFFINGFSAFFKGAPNMDTLVALGSGAAFLYSLYTVFVMSAKLSVGNIEETRHLIHNLYFESAAMILTLITVGKFLESRSKGKTKDAIKGLMDLAPKAATVIRNGQEVTVRADSLKLGDIFIVRSGESIPADGVIIEGEGAVDESALTGESIPVDKACGDTVTAASINRLGFMKCEVTRTAENNTLSQIIKLVSDTAATKASIAKIADKVSGVFVPAIIAIAFITFLIWLFLGKELGFAVARGISVLVISCPCALGLATPVAIMVGSGVGAKNGILFKTASSLETVGKVKIVALDKTGTVTEGRPEVKDIIPLGDITGKELLKIAMSVEFKSEHPLAKAIVSRGEKEGITKLDTDEFSVHTGSGIKATIGEKSYIAGNLKFIKTSVDISEADKALAEKLADNGKIPLFFAEEKTLLGIIAVEDAIRKDSKDAVSELKKLGVRVVMITGDNQKTADAIAIEAGIGEVKAEVLPDKKAEVVKQLMQDGKTIMVGDGINDAPALKMADVGIAIGRGSDIAIDAAEVVLMKNTIKDVAAAIRLSRAVIKNIRENLFWAFIYNVVGIPLAAGVFIFALGWEMNPMFGAAAMSLSSVSVVSNALRLNFAKIYGKNKKRENGIMERILKIEGMMCPHCEANVKSTLEGLEGVISAEVSHHKNTAVVKAEKEIDDELLKNAVEDKGYKVISID